MSSLQQRQSWISTLAKSAPDLLEQQVSLLGTLPAYRFLRSPEVGLTMVRGRIGGTGQPFNLGEVTLTRCVVQLENSDVTGFGYVAGRSRRHAELAAVCDALMQLPDWGDRVQATVITPLAEQRQQQQTVQQQQTDATTVNFFTLVRGE
jgi:alpha-D-ribose 1-methylphosphonate 5-triphosphate synthase subunit PhnG